MHDTLTPSKGKGTASAKRDGTQSSPQNDGKAKQAPAKAQAANPAAETIRRALAAAGTDEAGFRKLPKEEQNAFLAQAAGEQRPEVIAAAVAGREGFRLIERKNIARSSTNRHEFDEEKLQELAESIREHGIAQPIMVRPLRYEVIRATADKLQIVCHRGGGAAAQGSTRYMGPQFDDTPEGEEAADRELAKWQGTMPMFELVMGERRWRAAEIAKLDLLPCNVRELNDREALELQLTENLQREDLRPMDEARGYQQMQQLGYKVEEIAEKLKRSRSSIYDALKLLELPAEAKKAVESGKLPPTHALLVSTIDDEKEREKFAAEIVKPVQDYVHGGEKMISFRDAKARADELKKGLEDERKWQETAKEYASKPGYKVMTLQQSAGCFQYGSLKASYVGANDECDLDKQKRTWKALLGAHAPTAMVVKNGTYSGATLRVLFPSKAAEKGLQSAGHQFQTAADRNRSEQEKRRQEEEKERAAEAQRAALADVNVAKVVAAAEAREFNSEALRLIFARQSSNRFGPVLLRRRGFGDGSMDFQKREKAQAKMEAWLNKADAKTLRGLLLELTITSWHEVDHDALQAAAKVYGVKLQTAGKGAK